MRSVTHYVCTCTHTHTQYMWMAAVNIENSINVVMAAAATTFERTHTFATEAE